MSAAWGFFSFLGVSSAVVASFDVVDVAVSLGGTYFVELSVLKFLAMNGR